MELLARTDNPAAELPVVRVHGRVLRDGAPVPDYPVFVHGVRAVTDSLGHYDVEVRGRGLIVVQAPAIEGEMAQGAAVVAETDGAFEIDVMLGPTPPSDD